MIVSAVFFISFLFFTLANCIMASLILLFSLCRITSIALQFTSIFSYWLSAVCCCSFDVLQCETVTLIYCFTDKHFVLVLSHNIHFSPGIYWKSLYHALAISVNYIKYLKVLLRYPTWVTMYVCDHGLNMSNRLFAVFAYSAFIFLVLA